MIGLQYISTYKNMNYFLRIFCREKAGLPPEDVIAFIKDGFFFEGEPTISLQKENGSNWEIRITYDKEMDPVIISTADNDPESRKKIDEIKFILDISKQSEAKKLISNIIDSVGPAYTIQINQDQITDDCWEMLDSVEAMLLRSCNGILYTSDNEFFDEKLKKMYKL